MRFNNPHYYKILEINETASKEEISAAFRCLAKEYHPDRIPSHLPRLKHEAQEKLKQINEAYRVLSDPEKRRLYDVYLEALREEAERTRKYQASDYREPPVAEEEPSTSQEPAELIIACPKCNQKLKVPEGLALRVKCPSCGLTFDYPFVEEVDFITLQIFKNKAITFSREFVEYDGKRILYKDILRISYHSVYTSINLIPQDQTYSFSIGTDSDTISFTFSSGIFLIGNKEKKASFAQLVALSKTFIEPILVIKHHHILLGDMSVSIAGIGFSKNGFWRERWFRDPEFLTWDQYAGFDIQEGYIVLYKNVIGKKRKEFTRVSMSEGNAVILPELMALCANEFKKCSRPGVEICPSCGKEINGQFCPHCCSKTGKESHSTTERSWDDQWDNQSKNQYSSSGRQEESGRSEPTTGEAPRVGIWLRVFAYTIDFSILTCGIEALLWYVYGSIYPNFIIFLGYFLIFPLYFVYFMFLQSHDRQTIGERFMGIKVLPLSKTPLTKKKAILRYLCCLIPFYALATILSLLNSKRSIADAIIKTQVLQARKVPRVRFLLPVGLLIFWGLVESKARQENFNLPPKYAGEPPLFKQETGISLLNTIEKNLQSEKPLLSKQETGIGILSTQDIASKYWNSVVSISTYDAYLKNVGQGSGFVVDQSGIIVTNNHVVQSSLDPLIIFPNKEYYYASVLRRDITHDIAILKIKADNLPTVPLGDLWKISVGEKIVVIGSPLGLQNTVTEGIVSAIRVLEEDKTKILQISAPVSPGSSGSPVINSSGQCIGIATAIIKEGQNINFAVPIEYVVSLLGASKLPDVPKDEIKWITSFEEGMRLAKEQGKPVFICFFADWCLPCKEMEATTWRDNRVMKESERFVAIKLDSSKDDSPGSRLKIEKYNSFYIPLMVFHDAKGNYLEDKAIEGYANADTALRVMQGIPTSEEKLTVLKKDDVKNKDIGKMRETELQKPQLDPNKFYAQITSNVFHRLPCSMLKTNERLVLFNSYAEAVESGGIPCKSCVKDTTKDEYQQNPLGKDLKLKP